MVLLLDFVTYLDSLVLGWIAIDVLANLLLTQGQGYTKIRFFGTSFLSRRDAILLAYAQVVFAMLASAYVADYVLSQITTATAYLVPITLFTLAVFHAYVLMGLPYKVTLERLSLSLFLLAAAYFIQQRIGTDPTFASWLTSILH